MSKKLLAFYFSVLLFSVLVAGIQFVKVIEAQIPLPSEPQPPTVSIQAPIDGGKYFQDQISLVFTTNYKAPVGPIISITYTLDKQASIGVEVKSGFESKYSITLKGLSEGWHNLTVAATSLSPYNPGPGYNPTGGLATGTASVNFFVDAVSPTVLIFSPENKTYNTTDVPLNFTVSELARWIGLCLDGQTNITITGNTTLTGLSDGMHSLTIYANDTVGRFGTSGTIYFTLDTISPSISLLSPENKTYGTTDIPLTFTVTETASWIGYNLDAQGNATITGNATLTGLSHSSHNLTVYTKDVAGNIGASETIYFTIAQKEPFPITWVVPAIAIIVVVGAAFLVYFRKIKKSKRELGEPYV